MAKGKAVIKVMVCSDCNPPAFSNTKASNPNIPPQKTSCHLGEFVALLDEMLFITKMPESAEVTKKIKIIKIAKILTTFVNGKYSKNLNNKRSALSTTADNVPFAVCWSSHVALCPKKVIHKKLNKVGIISTAPINSRTVRPLEIFAINKPT